MTVIVYIQELKVRSPWTKIEKNKKTKIDSLKSIVRWNVKIEYKSNLQCIFQALHLYNITILEITIVSREKYYLIMMILSLPNASGKMKY